MKGRPNGDPFVDNGFIDLDGARSYVDTAIVDNVVKSLVEYKSGLYAGIASERDPYKVLCEYLLCIFMDKFHNVLLGKYQVDNMGYLQKTSRLMKLGDSGVNEEDQVKIRMAAKKKLQWVTEAITSEFLKYWGITEVHHPDDFTRGLLDEALLRIGVITPDVQDVYTKYGHRTNKVFRIVNPIGLKVFILEWIAYKLETDFGQKEFAAKFRNVLYGDILEEVVKYEVGLRWYELDQMEDPYQQNFRFKYVQVSTLNFELPSGNGEIDMAVKNTRTNTISLYEIKHSDKLVLNQAKHLVNEEFCKILSEDRYRIRRRVVLYNGKTTIRLIEGKLVQWKNISEFLYELPKVDRFTEFGYEDMIDTFSHEKEAREKGEII